MLCDLGLGQVAQTTLPTGRGAVSGQRQGTHKTGIKPGDEGRGVFLRTSGLQMSSRVRAQTGDELFHFPAVFALIRGFQQLIETTDEFFITAVGGRVARRVLAFPTERTHTHTSR